jgi:uncharacterized glyoxalase superfamily protein PhnB
MSGLSLGSIVIYVESGAKEVLEFYRTAFGLAVRYYDDGLKFGEPETGAPSIMVASYAAGEYMVGDQFRRPADNRPEGVEIAFLTDDVPAAFAKAVAAGAAPIREPRTMPWGQTVAYVRGTRVLSSVS